MMAAGDRLILALTEEKKLGRINGPGPGKDLLPDMPSIPPSRLHLSEQPTGQTEKASGTGGDVH
jgi:hypothetical protein